MLEEFLQQAGMAVAPGGEEGKAFRKFTETTGTGMVDSLISVLQQLPTFKSAKDGVQALYALRKLLDKLDFLRKEVNGQIQNVENYVYQSASLIRAVESEDLKASIRSKPRIPTIKKDEHPELYEELMEQAKRHPDLEILRPHFPGVQALVARLVEEDQPVPFAMPDTVAGPIITIRKTNE